MDWDKLRIFHAVASAGSFTHAGQMLALQPVGGQPPDQRAGRRNLHAAVPAPCPRPDADRRRRTALSGAVTDVLARLAAAEEALKNVHDAPRGSLKITASHGIGAYWLLPRLERIPGAISGGRSPSGDGRPANWIWRSARPTWRIRMRAPVQADLIQRKLFTVHYHMYASKAYLDEHGAPKSLEEICRPHHHRLWRDRRRRRSATSTGCWSITRSTASRAATAASSASTTSPASCRRWKRAWASAWCRTMSRPSIPSWCACCPTSPRPSFDVHLVYADALRQSKRVAAFRDFAGQGLQGLAVLAAPGSFASWVRRRACP